MGQNRVIQSTTTTRRNIRVFDSITTTNATPTIAGSISLGENRASYVEIKAFCITSGFTALQALDVQAGFRRPSGGNVTRATSNNGAGLPYLASSGDFSGASPTIDLVANTSTQTIDIVVHGKAGTTIKWHFKALSIQNLTI